MEKESEPLSLPAIDDLLRSISLTVNEIVIWQKKVRRLKDEIEKQEVTEDDVIYRDLHSFLKKARYETPLSTTFPIDGADLKVTVAHRHKGESVFGVDLVYEISENKIALFQYKKAHQGRFQIDRTQLGKLRYFCYDKCAARKYEDKNWFPTNSRIISLCPCYYSFVTPKDELVMPACVVESILDSKTKGRNSAMATEFSRGISRESFNEAFSKCWLGAAYSMKKNVDSMRDVLLSWDHMIIHCVESEARNRLVQ